MFFFGKQCNYVKITIINSKLYIKKVDEKHECINLRENTSSLGEDFSIIIEH